MKIDVIEIVRKDGSKLRLEGVPIAGSSKIAGISVLSLPRYRQDGATAKILTIKILRDHFGLGLAEAKHMVEGFVHRGEPLRFYLDDFDNDLEKLHAFGRAIRNTVPNTDNYSGGDCELLYESEGEGFTLEEIEALLG